MELVIYLLGLECKRDVEFALDAIGGAWCENPDDRVLLGVHADLLAQDVFVAAKAVFPEAIGEDHFQIFADLALLGEEVAAQKEGLTQDMEETWGARLGLDLFRVGRSAQAHPAAGPGSDGFKRGVLALPVQKVAGGDAVAVVVVYLGPDHDDAVGLVVRQRREQRGVYDAEDRGVGADAEGECQYRDPGEAGILPQEPQAKEQVAPAISHI